MSNIKPMLAATLKNLEDLKFPCIGQPKLDGIRNLLIEGKSFSRKLKLIPNIHVQNTLSKIELPNDLSLDGELMCSTFNDTQSKIMSIDGEPDFKYHVFDCILNGTYHCRMRLLELLNLELKYPFIKIVPSVILYNLEEFEKLEAQYIEQGYEGIIIRSLDGLYKFGRSTVKEGTLLKFKRFIDSEAIITGYDKLCKNIAESQINELGYLSKTHKLADLIELDAIGAFHVKDIDSGIEFKVSTGMSSEQRYKFFEEIESLIGKTICYKYQKVELNKPRFPVFKGLRPELD